MGQAKEDLYSRPPMERMLGIHEQLHASRFPNCTKLASQFEVTTRTIMRDIDFMKCRLNLPIEFDGSHNGYFYSDTVDQFPGISISEAELFALVVARKAVAQYHGTPFEKPLANAYRKLAAGLGQDRSLHFEDASQLLEFRPLGADNLDPELFEILCRAIRVHRAIRFHYRKVGVTKPQARRADPYQLACIDNRWYLFARDQARQEIRTFALTRMTGLELTATGFQRPVDWSVQGHLKGSFGVFKNDTAADFKVEVEFDAWAADILRGRTWHLTQETTELPSGQVRLTFRLANLEEIERWILSWGTHATPLHPKQLVQRIRNTVRSLAARYATSEKPTALST